MRTDEQRAKIIFERHQVANADAGRIVRNWTALIDQEKQSWISSILDMEMRSGGSGHPSDWGR